MANPFLDCKTFRKEPHQAGELGNTNDVFVSNITNIGYVIKGKSMVLAKRKNGMGPSTTWLRWQSGSP